MTAEAAPRVKSHYDVEVQLEERPGGEPRAMVRFARPGCEAEEMEYLQFMARPNNIPADREAKQEASRQRNALLKEWKPKPAQVAEEVKVPSFEITSVQADRVPWEEGFDQTKHTTVYYRQDGRERKDTPASLGRMIKEHPERFPADAAKQISMAVRAKVKSMEEQHQAKEAAVEPPAPAPIPSPQPQAEEQPTAAPGPSAADVGEVPAVSPNITEAESINRFLKLSREQGEEAAIAVKREEEAPRVQAKAIKEEIERRSDEELLRDGGWKDVVMEALAEDVAGDEPLKELCILSAAQTRLRKRDDQALLHIFIPGDSQVGKSWMFRNAGRILLPKEDFLSFTTMSGRGLNYLADESKDPKFFEGKVLFVDELAQQNQDARASLKVIMSIGQDEVSNLTVDDKKKSRKQSFTAMPTVWSCSAEAIEDAERQLLNRPLIAAVDESPDQTKLIHEMQRDKAAFGTFYAPTSRKPDALRLMNKIREARDAEVLVLFSDYYRPDDERARGMIPQFDALISAVAYCNRFARTTITDEDGHQIIFATFEDGIEATRLWGKFVAHKKTHLGRRYIQVLEALNELPKRSGQTTLNMMDVGDRGKTAEDLKEELNATLGKDWGLGYVRNMLTTLGKEGLAEYHECPDGKNRWVALMHPSHASHFITYENVTDGGEMLARRISELKRRSSHRHTKTCIELPEDLKERILPSSMIGR